MIKKKEGASVKEDEDEEANQKLCKFKTKCTPFSIPQNFPEQINLKEWDPLKKEHRLPPHFFMILEGSRRIGKSIFLKWLLSFYKDEFDLALVCTETSFNGFWQPIVGNEYVHSGWKPMLIMKLLASQTEELRKQTFIPNYKMRRVLLVLDDIIGDKRKIHEDEVLNKLAVQGRHSGISVALTTQDPKAINPTLRNNADVAVIFQQKNFRGKESVFHDFINIFENKHTAVDVLRRHTKDHDCVIVENSKLNEDPKKLYFHLSGDKTFDKDKINPKGEKGDSKCEDYQLGSSKQKILAQSERGRKPIFPTPKY
jgi:hypothetical protein